MLNSNEKLRVLRELEKLFRLEKLDELLSMRDTLQEIADNLHAEARKLPRNPCTPFGGMCACTGACIKPEAKALDDAGYNINSIIINLFK